MAILAESDRIFLRDYEPDADAEQAFHIYGDREVVRFIADGKPETSVETQRDALQLRVARFAENGEWRRKRILGHCGYTV